ncbi:DUF4381 domain-containing protein [Desulfosediminicola ganghwensis]|uniref:DUF4381 domain-containing protein n=1 Tax=Desulfosediminicola ganghwensis TaxID=2569540 RepID=UPI0010ABDEE3|nr:DUF4381 domain-containing protein [Desulfosediminicola ganghwensis]
MRPRGKKTHFSFLLAALLSPLCAPTLLPAQAEQPLRLLEPGGSGGSAPSSGAPASTTSANVPASLHDIHGPLQTAEPVPWLFYGLIALLAIGILAGIWWWFTRRAKPTPAAIPPSVKARDELMRAREMMTPELQLRYMEVISSILRNYLEQRFQLPTTRQTTREFFSTIARGSSKHSDLKRYGDDLKSCLEQCDMAKFAHCSRTIEGLQEMEDSVLRFINRTERPADEAWQTEVRGDRR